MGNTTLTMPALPREVQTHWTIFIGSKGHPLIDQPLNCCCTFFCNVTRSRFHHQTCTRIQGIAYMRINAVMLFVDYPDNAALRPRGSGFA